jgi:hypothetical protein
MDIDVAINGDGCVELIDYVEQVIELCQKLVGQTDNPYVRQNMDDIIDMMIDTKIDLEGFKKELEKNER